MKRVRGYVAKATNDRQQPWTNSSLNGEFYLKAASGSAIVTSSTTPEGPAPAGSSDASMQVASTPTRSTDTTGGDSAVQSEVDHWQAAERMGTMEAYQGYLRAYPNGRFASTANRKLDELAPGRAPEAAAAVAGDLKAQRADTVTEKKLNLSPEVIRDLHTRLVLLGHPTSGVRTTFTKASRKGLSAWQSSKGLVPTGYLNAGQLQLLNASSQVVYESWIAQGRPTLAGADTADEGGQSGASGQRRARGEGQLSVPNVSRNVGEALGGAARNVIGRKFGF
jgi:hypothetical protein